ncbi:MAG: ATP-binding protein [Armatimonadota bacterium]
MFIGRERELKKLESMYNSSEFECAIIYGRRRVGKTTLINEFCKGKPAIFFVGLESNARSNLDSFSKAIYSYSMPESSSYPIFQSFDDAFNQISTISNSKRLILVIDEFPYLAEADRSISSILQKHIDHTYKGTKVFIILCGSSMSFMENQVLGYKSPLYGRRTAQLKVMPFTYYETAKFHPNYNIEDKALIYGITGGVPLYIEKINPNETIEWNIKENLLDESSYLFEEPSNLLKQELREPRTYNAIITAIAGGASRLNEIATKAGLETSSCSKYLVSLISLGIIKKEYPLTEKSSKRSIYRISENLFDFWFRFIPRNIAGITSGNAESVYRLGIEPYLSDYMGLIFEDICRDYLLYQCPDLPFDIGAIGQWWGNNPSEKKQAQIDILAISPDGSKAIFGECKYTNSLFDIDSLEKLINASSLVPGIEEKHYCLFSKSGFTADLISNAASDNLRLVTLDDIYR